MKKYLLLLLTFLQIGLAAQADSYLPWYSQVNNKMFSPEETRPYLNLERTKYTNHAIMDIETKYSIRPNENQTESTSSTTEDSQQKGIKSLFKGFVVEW